MRPLLDDGFNESCTKSLYFCIENELEYIQERYVQVLRSYLQHTNPHNPSRLNDLLGHIPEVSITAQLLE